VGVVCAADRFVGAGKTIVQIQTGQVHESKKTYQGLPTAIGAQARPTRPEIVLGGMPKGPRALEAAAVVGNSALLPIIIHCSS